MLLVFRGGQRKGGGGGSPYLTEKQTQMNVEKLIDVIHRKDCLIFLGNHGR